MEEGLIREASKVLKRILYINIASITPEGKPWNTPVYCAFDRKLNYYWASWKLNQHSKNIRNNSSVFITVYNSTVPEGTGFGVYFEGKASELRNPKEIIIGLKELYSRKKKSPRDIIQFLNKFPRRVYKFVPQKVWVNGDGKIDGNYIDVRTEINLEKLIKATCS